MTDQDLERLKARLATEHEALHAEDFGRALAESGKFHTDIARIANQATIAAFIDTLVARSSLIVALYWKRRSAICEEFAHGALVEAFEKRDGPLAEDLMHSHIVDLATSLDLRENPAPPASLREALRR